MRGAAIFTGTALVVTIALVLLLNRFAFPANGVTGARLVLLIALAASAAFGIAVAHDPADPDPRGSKGRSRTPGIGTETDDFS